MYDYFIYYASSNIVGVIIFGIMLAHDRLGVDRQEKQLKYDQVLIAFMLYFISDALWSGVDSGVFPVNRLSVLLTNFSNFLISTFITYSWIRYVMAVEQVPGRNSMKTRLLLYMPVFISVIILIITYLANPGILIDENMKTTGVFDIFFVSMPYIYLVAVIIYAMKKAIREDDPIEKKKHLAVSFFPMMVVVGGLTQILVMPTLPCFCFGCTIFMLIFFIKSLDDQVSTDPLTKLNNRGQLARYVSQENNLRIEGRLTYVIMIDINFFKKINDTYGHAEGDKALVILSQALVQSVRGSNMPIFLGRFGGDEFVIIAHPVTASEIEELKLSIRKNVADKCHKEKKEYILSIGIGCDMLLEGNDSFHKCMQRADDRLYEDKEEFKKNITQLS